MQENKKEQNQSLSKVDEIDFRLLFNFLFRNKFLISSLSLIFFILACFYSLTIKRVWQGQFQIVLNNKEEKLNPNITPLQRFAGINQNNDLQTEVEILKSPSILKPIFEFVISKKDPENKFKLEEEYDNWQNKNLDVELKTGTKVLNISYRDDDKELIIPVLKKMTSSYQNYSGRNKKRIQEITEKYLLNQINLFKEKSSNSLKAAQNFAIDQDLVDYGQKIDTINIENNITSNGYLENPSNLLLSNIGIERKRVEAANEIRRINIQLKKINQLNDSEELQYIGSTIPALVESGLPDILKNIEQKLVQNRAKYTDKDLTIITLIEERDMIIDLLKNRTINYLKISKLEAEARMEAAMRPKGVLLKYKEFIREAQRDELTLIKLENQLRIIQLEKAKEEDPWELITNPTLLKAPVAPSRKTIGLLGIIIGSLCGILLAFYREKKSGKLFNMLILEDMFKAPIIEKITIDSNSLNLEKILFITKFFKNLSGNNFSLISIGDIPDQKINKFIELIKSKLSKDKKINFLTSLSFYENQMKFDFDFLIVRINKLKIYDLRKFSEKMKFLDYKIKGIILIED